MTTSEDSTRLAAAWTVQDVGEEPCPWQVGCRGLVWWQVSGSGRCCVCGGECLRCPLGHAHAADDDLDDCEPET